MNPELATVNAEVQQRGADLSLANNDMNNLLAGTGVGRVFMDLQLCILPFTPAATELLNLIPGDAGGPMGHIVSIRVGYYSLLDDVKEGLDTVAPKEVELKTKSGAW